MRYRCCFRSALLPKTLIRRACLVSGDEIQDPGLGCLMLGTLLSHPCCLVAGWLPHRDPCGLRVDPWPRSTFIAFTALSFQPVESTNHTAAGLSGRLASAKQDGGSLLLVVVKNSGDCRVRPAPTPHQAPLRRRHAAGLRGRPQDTHRCISKGVAHSQGVASPTSLLGKARLDLAFGIPSRGPEQSGPTLDQP